MYVKQFRDTGNSNNSNNNKKLLFVYFNIVTQGRKILGRISNCLLPLEEFIRIGSMPSPTKTLQVKTVRKNVKEKLCLVSIGFVLSNKSSFLK